MNKKLIIILTISIVCSLGLGLLVGYFIPIDKANSKTLSSDKDGNISSLETPKYITNSDTYKQTKTYTITRSNLVKIDKSDKLKYPKIDPKTVKFRPKDSGELTSNIEILDSVYVENDYNGYLQIYARNNNKKSVSIDFYVAFYDSTGKEVYKTFGHPGTFTFSNTEFAVSLSMESTVKYTSYEVIYSAKDVEPKHQSFEELKDTKYYILQEADGNVRILFKNLSNHDISQACFSFFLYKNGKLVWCNSGITGSVDDIPADYGDVSISYVSNFDNIEYDDFKVVLSGVYKINK